MRMLLQVEFPPEPFNTLVRKGTAGSMLGKIVEELHPEAAYFTESHGHRSAMLVVDVNQPSDVPRFAEPFFLHFHADCRFRIVMGPEDLQKADLEGLGKKWS